MLYAKNTDSIIKNKFSFKKKAFTLVELIVVIVILAILATIAFLSFSSQSASARDSTRLADMSNIAKWLSVFNASAGTYPKPDSAISITASWVEIWKQWYAWSSVLWMIKLSNGWKDPLDGSTYCTYNVNAWLSKFQLLGFLEDWNNSALSLNPYAWSLINADSVSYSGRYVITKWDMLGVLLQSWSMAPVQASTAVYWNNIELKSYTWWEFIWYVSKSIKVQWTWSILWWLAWVYALTSASSKYPSCNVSDIKLSNWQIWAACNVGATEAWAGQVTINVCSFTGADCNQWIRNILGGLFQWWRNDNVASTSATWTPAPAWTLANTVWHDNFITEYNNRDWYVNPPQNNNLWWWSGTTSTGWTYISLWMPSAMQWPCASGYHVPTQLEWCSALSAINPNLNCSWSQSDTAVALVLKLPLWGSRNYSHASYYAGNYWRYWTSSIYYGYSPDNIMGWVVVLKSTAINTPWYDNRGEGDSVRCMKN
ncbi:MAG: hypothetical protein ACD_3C00141G0003 [uncultured bacterium (gcode 4)]|uniref:Fibrobacter succinogenes major paralogous domain-containing protein n=1 Tax=uncultured bacterium (gcode 4) TaxID=1234023 RepID=K2F9R9_9BACT|nr:MAG: hypothetical protein ACD_3C00141G0003 [uncultured bacterium (gcode 4)]